MAATSWSVPGPGTPPKVTMYELPVLQEAECSALVRATEAASKAPGYFPSTVRFDPATEVPLQDLPEEVSRIGVPQSEV